MKTLRSIKLKSVDVILSRLTKLYPKIIDLSLDRVVNLLEKLKNPHRNIPAVIHVAGTNGKGSTLSFLKAGLEANNKSVHSYTSPHLVTFNERIKLKGKKINEALLIDYLETCERVNQNNNITFFEITTCAAFMAFSKHKADYTLLEVGLGGRLDATNVIESPTLSIITPISLDHQKFLGNSILEITGEKAGILKPNVPAIIGKQTNEVQEKICSIAESLDTPISLFGRDWFSEKYKDYMIYQDHDGLIELPAPKLEGIHQYENAGIAINALRFLKTRTVSLSQALQNANWPARLQRLKSGPLVDQVKQKPFHTEIWLDGGHNQAAANAIASFLNQPFLGNCHVIIGMINSKNIKSFLLEISNCAKSIGCITIPNEPASLDKDEIFKELQVLHSNAFKADSLSIALDTILNGNFHKNDIRVLICGSLYLCGNVLHDHD